MNELDDFLHEMRDLQALAKDFNRHIVEKGRPLQAAALTLLGERCEHNGGRWRYSLTPLDGKLRFRWTCGAHRGCSKYGEAGHADIDKLANEMRKAREEETA